MRHQPEITLNKRLPGLLIALLYALNQRPFFGGCQRLGEGGYAPGNMGKQRPYIVDYPQKHFGQDHAIRLPELIFPYQRMREGGSLLPVP